MNYAQIAISCIILNLCFGIVCGTGVFGTVYTEDLVSEKLSENRIIEVLTGTSSFSINVLDLVGYIQDAIDLFLIPLQAAFYIPKALGSDPFHTFVPDPIVNIVFLGMIAVYAVGIADFIRGVSGGGIQ